jgi:hypothetical protein
MDKVRREFQQWSSQKLQADYKEEEKDLTDYLKNHKDSLVERVGWVINGSYGSEIYHILTNRYLDIIQYKKGKNILSALRALAIEAFYFYCFSEHKALNAAKVRAIVKKAYNKEEMERFNDRILKEEILQHFSEGKAVDLDAIVKEKKSKLSGVRKAKKKSAKKKAKVTRIACTTSKSLAGSGDVEFWMKSFKPRTKKWRKDTLKRLRSGKANPFESAEERADKIEALKRLD